MLVFSIAWFAASRDRKARRHARWAERQNASRRAWRELENALREPYDAESKSASGVAYETEPKSAGVAVYEDLDFNCLEGPRPVLISDGWCSCCQPNCSQCGRHVDTCSGCGSELAPGETTTCEWCIKDTYMRQRQEEEQQWHTR